MVVQTHQSCNRQLLQLMFVRPGGEWSRPWLGVSFMSFRNLMVYGGRGC